MSLFDTGIRPTVDAWLLAKSKEERDYGDYWSASSAGYCQRKVIFERLGVPKIEQDGDARKQRVFTSGHIFHQWIQEITKKTGLSIAQELELQDEDLMIRGHIDDLVLVPETVKWQSKETQLKAISVDEKTSPRISTTPPISSSQHLILYDYKTVNSRSFMWAKKNGNAMSRYHRLQLGTYMYMLRNKGQELLNYMTNAKIDAHKYGLKPVDIPNLPVLTEARILKIEKDSLMMGEQQLMWSDELEKEVVAYWTTLNDYWGSKKIPPCSCADHENGFMAKPQYNGYYYEGEPCSLKYYKKCKKEGLIK